MQAGKKGTGLPVPPPHFTGEASGSPRELSLCPGHTISLSQSRGLLVLHPELLALPPAASLVSALMHVGALTEGDSTDQFPSSLSLFGLLYHNAVDRVDSKTVYSSQFWRLKIQDGGGHG